MRSQKIAIIIISILGMMSTFLPWINAPEIIGNINGMRGDGWVTFLFFLFSIMCVIFYDRGRYISQNPKLIISLFGLLSSLTGLWRIINFTQTKNKMLSESSEIIYTNQIISNINTGIGLYLLVLSGIALIVICNINTFKKYK